MMCTQLVYIIHGFSLRLVVINVKNFFAHKRDESGASEILQKPRFFYLLIWKTFSPSRTIPSWSRAMFSMRVGSVLLSKSS